MVRSKCLVTASLFLMGLACSEEAQEALETFEEQPATVRVEAAPNVCWSGSIGNSTKEGCGSDEFLIEGEAIVVANAQKQQKRGTLTMILEIEGQVVDRATTTAAYGIVTVSE